MAKKTTTKEKAAASTPSHEDALAALRAKHRAELLELQDKVDRDRESADLDAFETAMSSGKHADLWAKVKRIYARRGGTGSGVGNGRSSGGRVRRTAEQFKADAEKLVAVIKSGGKEGAKARDVKAVGVKTLPETVMEFVKKHAGVEIKKSGELGGTRYHYVG